MIGQFKTHVWCHLEFSHGAMYHAANVHLAALDGAQSSFTHSLGLSVEDAFLRFNFAPLCLRRDIAILGLLHKITLGLAHPSFSDVFPMRSAVHVHEHDTRQERRRHSKQFVEHCDGGQTGYFGKSIFSACRVYNFLPSYMVIAKTVSQFQSFLTKDSRLACRNKQESWPHLYYCRSL